MNLFTALTSCLAARFDIVASEEKRRSNPTCCPRGCGWWWNCCVDVAVIL